jgi:exopolysaccharide biosynthesis polyprenyl glycosylphosphotransferase
VVLDLVTVLLSMWLAFAIHSHLVGTLPYLKIPPQPSEYKLLALFTPVLWIGLVVVFQLHRSFEHPTGRFRLLFELLKMHIVGLVGIAMVMFLLRESINRSMVVLFLMTSFCLMFAVRLAIGARVKQLYLKGYGQEQILLVGPPGPEMRHFVASAARDSLPPRVVGRVDIPRERDDQATDEGVPPEIGDIGNLDTILQTQAIDHVVFFPPVNRPELVPGALRACEDRGVLASFSVDLVQIARAVPRISFFGDQPFVSFDVAPKSPASLAIKHGIDMVTAGVALVVLSPILLCTCLAILVTMGRPIFFFQERAGLNGRRFRMIKFRTMVKDAEARKIEVEDRNELSGPVFKFTDDPRVTKLGRFLRKTSIDELPQLGNVLVGNMSLVGPRPLPLKEQEQISGLYRRRLTMRPGITGLWQVSGRNDIDFEQWMELDLRYVDQWSLAFDFWILVRTVPAVLLGKGAR